MERTRMPGGFSRPCLILLLAGVLHPARGQEVEVRQPTGLSVSAQTRHDGKRLRLSGTARRQAANVQLSPDLKYQFQPLACASAEILLDNGFEDGDYPSGPDGASGQSSAWFWTSSMGLNPIAEGYSLSDGGWGLYMGDWGERAEDSAYQQVTLPADAAFISLSYYRMITTEETAASDKDRATVEVLDEKGVLLETLVEYSNQSGDGKLYRRGVEITKYKGKTIRVRFRIQEDGENATAFMIDDVYISVLCAARPGGSRVFTVVNLGLGSGTGRVTTSPAGIDCAANTSCVTTFADDTVVTLTAAPAAGTQFFGFEGTGCGNKNPCTLGKLDSARGMTAVFWAPPQDLLLSKGRVRVTVDWRNQYSGQTGKAFSIYQDDQFGFFYFATENNPEVFVKVLDFGSGNPNFLLFYSGLTDFEYKVTYQNVQTGKTAVFTKPAGSALGGVDNASLPK